MIKILIADDHAIVRRGLKQILAETPDMVVAGEAHNGQELLEKARGHQWDVVVLDISMPGRGGLDADHSPGRSVCGAGAPGGRIGLFDERERARSSGRSDSKSRARREIH